MTLVGTIFFEKEKLEFLFIMGVYGKKNIYFKYKEKIYDLRYLINMFKFKKLF